jgi:outer membrane protein OmpA-like peptidoglycan-associated protein
MNSNVRAIAGSLATLTIGACAQAPPPPPPREPIYYERVILLPSRDGTPSTLVIERGDGVQVLTTPYAAVETTNNEQRRTVIEPEDVEKQFGNVLESQPAKPFSLLLFFDSGTTRIAPRSQGALAAFVDKVRSFPTPQAIVIGHTDRVGADAMNDVLSVRRAIAIRDMLIELGVAPGAIEISGRGEREPLVVTPDGVPEERNRRVEINFR